MKRLTFFLVLLIVILSSVSFAKADTLFIKDLYFGIQNDTEVNKLQEFLTDQGLYAGPITGNFYSLTLKAVKQFQTREGITPSSGYFGPKTRIKINELLTAQVKDSETQAISETGTSTPAIEKQKTTNDVVVSLQQQIQTLLQQMELLKQQQTTQQQTNQSIQNLQNTISQQTQVIQQQQQTLTQIQQNTAPAPVVVGIPTPASTPAPAPQPTTISISRITTSTFQITNNGPSTIRIKKIVFSGIGGDVEPYEGINLGPYGNSIYYERPSNYGPKQKYNLLDCNGLKTFGVFGVEPYDPCIGVKSFSNNNGSPVINELNPNETLEIWLAALGMPNFKTLKHVPGGIIETSTGNDVSFADFNF